MSRHNDPAVQPKSFAKLLAFWIAVLFVVVGMVNSMPGIPGLDRCCRISQAIPFSQFESFHTNIITPLLSW